MAGNVGLWGDLLPTSSSTVTQAQGYAGALVERADEAEGKGERKGERTTLRKTAVRIQQGVASVRKSIDAESSKFDAKASEAPQRITGRLFNNSDDCSWAENLRFAISCNGQQVVETQLVFPGAITRWSSRRARTRAAPRYDEEVARPDRSRGGQEGWTFKSGYVNHD